jgi:glucose/arabinose dehydrogenase
MTICSSPTKGTLLAAAFATALTICPASAQQSTPTPPPPTPSQPTSEAAGKLRGVNPPPFPMAADKLPTPHLKLPKGFKVEVFISGVPNARSLRQGDKGTVFVSNRLLDKVYAVVAKGEQRELKVLASGLDRPNGLAFAKGALYIAEGTRISKLEKVEDNIDNPPKPVVRPVDVEVMNDGSLLVSDDYAGAIYRISYDGRRVARR